MTESVIADGMSGRMNSPHQVRSTLRLLTDGEERRLHASVRQSIEDVRRPFRIRSIVEREIDTIGAHDYPAFNLPKLRDSASRVSQ